MIVRNLIRAVFSGRHIITRSNFYHINFFRNFNTSMVMKSRIASVADTEKLLTEMKIPFYTIHHEPVFTVAEMLEKCKSDKGPITYCKNLFILNKKTDEYLLIIALHDTEVDLKMMRKWLSVGSRDLRFGEEDVLKKYLDAKKGAVNPFSLANDTEHKVKLLVDKKMFECKELSFHPMQNDALTIIASEDLKKFVKELGREYSEVDFIHLKKQVEEDATKTESKKESKKEGKKKTGKKGKNEEEEKKKHELGVEYSKEENLPMWYQQVLKKADLIEYSQEISGCYVFRPWSFAIWERIQAFLDLEIKKHGVENAYFPMFVPKSVLEKEQSHVEGFKAEVAWVTKSGDTDLVEPLAIRPTSETIMYPYFQKWIHSHRDLPLKINQWTNVVRWEFKDPTPFIRTREFLWQEGHTAHSTAAEAEKTVYEMLEVYRKVYEELLAIPVFKGVKSEEEKFPGALYTTSVETIIPANGRAVQAATSHNLGQNFSKIFGIQFENQKGENELVWQTSWGLTTRSIGIMILLHGDDGLVIPPRVAPIQVVLIPIHYKEEERKMLSEKLAQINEELIKINIRTKIDDRDIYTPGWKYNHWELKGVPLRLEFGMKDFKDSAVSVVRRDTKKRIKISWENLSKEVPELLENIQESLLMKAKENINKCIVKEKRTEGSSNQNSKKSITLKLIIILTENTWDGFMKAVNSRKACYTPWCKKNECEVKVKARSREESKKLASLDPNILTGSIKTLNIPLEGEQLKGGEKCFACGQPAECVVLWGRSY